MTAHLSPEDRDELQRLRAAIEAVVNTWQVEVDDDEHWLYGSRVSVSEAQELPSLIRQARTHIREIRGVLNK